MQFTICDRLSKVGMPTLTFSTHKQRMNSLQKGSYPILPGSSFLNNSNGLVSVKYNFKPESVDRSRKGDMKKIQDTYQLNVPSTLEDGRPHVFEGSGQHARNVDCVLVYNPKNKTFTIEQMDEIIRVHALRNGGRAVANSAPQQPPEPMTQGMAFPSVSSSVPSSIKETPNTAGLTTNKGPNQSSHPQTSSRRSIPAFALSAKNAETRPNSTSTRDFEIIEIESGAEGEADDVLELDDFAKELELGLDQELGSNPEEKNSSATGKPISLRDLSMQEGGQPSASPHDALSSASEED
ncbi:RNA polymerase II transcription elongation factor SpEAF [Schizosaccharomyces cryophilus OY26]|uniref:RNA polymerase II transcription elongation factor SpEAF n=1 Tax=Schizosaccharomyces cryophilus (strain OY26 / ATCC MYA-4695 / CBS 11777 / NBRC 106824 / NRRL Y48691) TaxID=653667 RepID=S9XED0_SCHCR|nr:RNA polymerase II transcription elongation factor SpEAF [Schizosaccharomyces cryophilus OY26]EPY52136.1 RNA polymerase II transcription elongation factor SpEAF [Schizosaccharomyces cryophilus OY26]